MLQYVGFSYITFKLSRLVNIFVVKLYYRHQNAGLGMSVVKINEKFAIRNCIMQNE